MKNYFKSYVLCGIVLCMCTLSAPRLLAQERPVRHNFAGMEGEALMKRFGAFKKTPQTKTIQVSSLGNLQLGYFFDNRAFVYNHEDGAFCIDKKGNKLKSWKGEEAEQIFGLTDMPPHFGNGRVMIAIPRTDYTKTAIIYDTLFHEIKRFEKVERVSDFVGGVAFYQKMVQVKAILRSRNFFVDVNGNEVLKAISDAYTQNDIEVVYHNNDMRPMRDGLVAFCVPKPDNFTMRLWGFRNAEGKIVIPAKYDKVQNFSHGLAAVATGEWDNARWGFIDTKGRMVIPQKFSREPSPFDACGLALVVDREGRSAYMDKKGQILPNRYDQATPFVNGRAFCRNEFDDGCALIDSAQHIKSVYGFEMAARVSENQQGPSDYYQHDSKDYTYVNNLAHFGPDIIIYNEKFYVKVRDAGYGLLDNKGNLVICGLAGCFSCGIAPVYNPDEGVAGYVNDKGEWVVIFEGSEF